LFGTLSAIDVYSEHQFQTTYAAYVASKDAAAVATTNANIVGSAAPTDAHELGMHRWYHDVSVAVQAEAKAIMDKALAAKPGSIHTTASCFTDIAAAWSATDDWAHQLPIYNKIMGDTDTGLSNDEKKARACINALSGADKELALKVGLRGKLFGLFKTKFETDVLSTDMSTVSKMVSGTLAAAAGANANEGHNTQPMYYGADTVLRRQMMELMVGKLNAKLPIV